MLKKNHTEKSKKILGITGKNVQCFRQVDIKYKF